MNEEERRVIVDQEMVKALKFLTDAEELARLEMWNVVANRAYYALYHAVMAMMVNDGFLPRLIVALLPSLAGSMLLQEELIRNIQRFFLK